MDLWTVVAVIVTVLGLLAAFYLYNQQKLAQQSSPIALISNILGGGGNTTV